MKRFALGPVAVAAFLVMPFLGACSSSPSGATTGGTGGTGGTTTGGSGGGYTGSVGLAHITVPTSVFAISGEFFAGTASNGTCAGMMMGSCCYTNANPDAGTVTPTLVSAGVITIHDGSAQLGQLTFDAGDGYNALDSITDTTLLWGSGDTITISATGATVPAFSGTVVVPDDLTVTSPTLSLTTPTTVPVASDLVISWTTNAQTVDVFLAGSVSGPSIFCTGTGAAGGLTVPHQLLGNLSGDGFVQVLAGNFTTVGGGNSISLSAVPGPVMGAATFQ